MANAPLLTENGFTFRDLNKNGRLDPYEDTRLPVAERVEDLLAQMTLEEKAGLMFHTIAAVNPDGSLEPPPEGRFRAPISEQVTRFTRAELLHACRNDIDSRVHVTVMRGAAFGTHPPANRQRKLFQFMAATRTGFAAGEPAINLNESAAIPRALVFKLSRNFSPASITDCSGKPGVFNHVFNRQILDGYNIKLFNQSGCELVRSVLPLRFDLTVNSGDAEPLFVISVAAFLPSGQTALLLSQIPNFVRVFLRVFNLCAVTQGRQVRQTKINTNNLIRDWQNIDINFGAERNIKPAVSFALERDHVRPDNFWQRFCKFNFPKLWQRNNAISPLWQTDILESQRGRVVVSGSIAWIPRLFASLHAPVEMLKRLILIAQGLGEACRRWVGEPVEFRQFLQAGETAGYIDPRDRFFSALISFCAGRKRVIPQPTRCAEPFIQLALLPPIGIATNLKASLYGRHTEIVIRIFKEVK